MKLLSLLAGRPTHRNLILLYQKISAKHHGALTVNRISRVQAVVVRVVLADSNSVLLYRLKARLLSVKCIKSRCPVCLCLAKAIRTRCPYRHTVVTSKRTAKLPQVS